MIFLRSGVLNFDVRWIFVAARGHGSQTQTRILAFTATGRGQLRNPT